MITEQDLAEAIAECQGVRNPNAATCIKLAAFLTIREHLFPLYPKSGEDQEKIVVSQGYSNASEPMETIEKRIDYISDTDFSRAIDGRKASEIWSIMDELMTVLQATNQRLYDGVMRKISE